MTYLPIYEHGLFLYVYIYNKFIVFFMKLIPGESIGCFPWVTMNRISFPILDYFSGCI